MAKASHSYDCNARQFFLDNVNAFSDILASPRKNRTLQWLKRSQTKSESTAENEPPSEATTPKSPPPATTTTTVSFICFFFQFTHYFMEGILHTEKQSTVSSRFTDTKYKVLKSHKFVFFLKIIIAHRKQ